MEREEGEDVERREIQERDREAGKQVGRRKVGGGTKWALNCEGGKEGREGGRQERMERQVEAGKE